MTDFSSMSSKFRTKLSREGPKRVTSINFTHSSLNIFSAVVSSFFLSITFSGKSLFILSITGSHCVATACGGLRESAIRGLRSGSASLGFKARCCKHCVQRENIRVSVSWGPWPKTHMYNNNRRCLWSKLLCDRVRALGAAMSPIYRYRT